jgi:ankyrin repeat protein
VTIIKKIKKFHHLLNNACRDDDIEAVKTLLQQDEDLSEIWTEDDYPLQLAAGNDNIELCKLLIESGMPNYWNSKYGMREKIGELNELSLAITWSDSTMFTKSTHNSVMYLIEQGAHINSPHLAFNSVLALLESNEREKTSNKDTYFNYLVPDQKVSFLR